MKCITLVGVLLFSPLFLIGQKLLVPEKLVLSAPLKKECLPVRLEIKNTDDKSIVLQKLLIKGRQATDFHLTTPLTFPLTINAGDSLELGFTFKPNEKTGIHNAILEVYSPDAKDNLIKVKLSGLAAQGIEGENEPSLFLILKTLGYNINIGGDQLKLGTLDSLIGDEIKVSQFIAASKNKRVSLLPVARYSPPEQVPFGYFSEVDNQLKYEKVGTLSAEYLQHQSLYPRLASGKTTFNPKENSFGIFVSTSSHVTYTKSSLNTGVEHACRVYPIKDASGKVVENQYLVCFEEAKNGDYQDFVFILENVRPSP